MARADVVVLVPEWLLSWAPAIIGAAVVFAFLAVVLLWVLLRGKAH